MLLKNGKKIKIIVGKFNFKDGPNDIFSEDIILLLNEISKEILNNKKMQKISRFNHIWFLVQKKQYK